MLKVGTDFSGIGSPEQALKNLGVKHKLMFACDVDKYAKQSFLSNNNPEIFYNDITKRNHKNTPDIDLYVAGFPCQSFSCAGKRKGFEDTRGTLFFELLKYLKVKKPKYFILENVKGLLSHDAGKTFAIILDCLALTVNRQYSFTTYDESLNYYIYYKLLNTKDYGIPQNRERVFIVGFKDKNHDFKFPKPVKLEKKISDFLETKHSQNLEIKGVAQRGRVDNKNEYKKQTEIRKDNLINTIIKDQTTSMIKIGNNIRKFSPLEALRFQGFPDQFYYNCKHNGISNTQIYNQAGNSITVNVMSALINEILKNENNVK